jgi:hypothetical protein
MRYPYVLPYNSDATARSFKNHTILLLLIRRSDRVLMRRKFDEVSEIGSSLLT